MILPTRPTHGPLLEHSLVEKAGHSENILACEQRAFSEDSSRGNVKSFCPTNTE